MPTPDSIRQLCETFACHRAHYNSAGYNETELRREFLDPFFKALGWDVDNTAGYADAYKDVIHEDAIRIGAFTKAPDYCFRIGGTRKFFVEAKKPSVNIETDTAPAFQLRRYGWSAKLPLCILTDFEELAVYDTRVKPAKTDRPATARILYFTFDQYVEKWGEITAIFARESVLRGSFDKYADTAKGKRGTGAVDDAFLAEIERWRELLARNLARRNAALTVRDLNFAVQKIIDRIVFLRICEDRGTEDYGRLQVLVNGPNTYRRLMQHFHQADARYNSGLFHFDNGERDRSGTPDTLTPHLAVDDAVLKDILKNLYYPESPYEFSVLPADILGQVYECFLGKTIRLTGGHQAKIEEKPEVRKAGGVYYTPAYIVDYIVQNTLGRLLDGDEPSAPKPVTIAKAAEIKVLDPACGSGSFLIVAYQYLLDWHLRQYTADPVTGAPDPARARRNAAGKSPKIYQAAGGQWRLTTAERKRILLNGIHGVDIDAQAVEVTKLSLLLKVLEGETQQQLQRDFLSERQRILPDLGGNIKCGNSLIGPDFYENEQMLLLDDESQYRINVFDWKKAFPDILKRGGFDCVIGNPPYVRSRHMDDHTKAYYTQFFSTAQYQPDLFSFFVERGTQVLSPIGKLGYIIPSGILTNTQYEPLRRYLVSNCPPEIVVDLKESVFANAAVDTIILVLGGAKRADDPRCSFVIGECPAAKLLTVQTPRTSVKISAIANTPTCVFNTGSSKESFGLIDRIGAIVIHGSDFFVVRAGMKVRKELVAPQRTDERYQPFLRGANVNPYWAEWTGRWVCYDKSLEIQFSNQAFRDRATFEAPSKILVRQVMGKDRIYASLDEQQHFVDQSLYVLLPKDRREQLSYLLGLLCSKLLGYCFNNTLGDRKRTFPKIKGDQIAQLPIRPIDFDNPADVAMHDKMVLLVERMLELNKKKSAERNPDIITQLETQIAATDRQIDRLVYDLYALTPGEIAIVEGGKA